LEPTTEVSTEPGAIQPEYTDWNTAIRPTGALRGKHLAARATAVLEGTADEIKNKAHRRLLTLTHR
jgi:hypothetical protein